MKMVSLNFRIATNILKTAVNRQAQDRACTFCKERNETIYHLFLECPKLKDIRNDLSNYSEATRRSKLILDWNYIINMTSLTDPIEYDIISLYKKTIWLSACNIRFNQQKLTIRKMRAIYEKEISFYLKHIHNN